MVMALLLVFNFALITFYCCHLMKLFLSFDYTSLSTKWQKLALRVG